MSTPSLPKLSRRGRGSDLFSVQREAGLNKVVNFVCVDIWPNCVIFLSVDYRFNRVPYMSSWLYSLLLCVDAPLTPIPLIVIKDR